MIPIPLCPELGHNGINNKVDFWVVDTAMHWTELIWGFGDSGVWYGTSIGKKDAENSVINT